VPGLRDDGRAAGDGLAGIGRELVVAAQALYEGEPWVHGQFARAMLKSGRRSRIEIGQELTEAGRVGDKVASALPVSYKLLKLTS
jgi:hypothetical protein